MTEYHFSDGFYNFEIGSSSKGRAAAADYLRTVTGRDDKAVEWVDVRPDGLIDEDSVTGYQVYESPVRSAIFDAGTTSRINVAHFIAGLIRDNAAWHEWKGRMPVIYNKESLHSAACLAKRIASA
jgi:hypothetical protein